MVTNCGVGLAELLQNMGFMESGSEFVSSLMLKIKALNFFMLC